MKSIFLMLGFSVALAVAFATDRPVQTLAWSRAFLNQSSAAAGLSYLGGGGGGGADSGTNAFTFTNAVTVFDEWQTNGARRAMVRCNVGLYATGGNPAAIHLVTVNGGATNRATASLLNSDALQTSESTAHLTGLLSPGGIWRVENELDPAAVHAAPTAEIITF